ncbi:MAG: glycosyltransferase family 4 protein [Chromatiaceae bacterium]
MSSRPPLTRIRIAFLIQFLSIGGIETRMLKILRAIDRDRFEPTIICARDDGLQADAFKALGFPIVTTRGLLAVNRAIQAAEVPCVLWRAGVRRFDVVFSFLASSQPFEVYLARFGCRPGGFGYALMNRDRLGVEPYWTKRKALASVIVSVSRKTAEFFYPPGDSSWDKLRVIPNGVDLERFAANAGDIRAGRAEFGLPESAVVFCYPARIAPQKQHEVLLDVAERVATRDPRVHFALAGQDKRDGWLQSEILRRDLSATVTYVGPMHDIERLLAVSDAIMLTSAWEGCPNALLEGMAAGLPIVVTQSGAEEFVEEGVTGFSVPVGDAEAFADRICRLLADPDLRRDMGGSGRNYMEREGSLEVMLKRWEGVLHDLGSN